MDEPREAAEHCLATECTLDRDDGGNWAFSALFNVPDRSDASLNSDSNAFVHLKRHLHMKLRVFVEHTRIHIVV